MGILFIAHLSCVFDCPDDVRHTTHRIMTPSIFTQNIIRSFRVLAKKLPTFYQAKGHIRVLQPDVILKPALLCVWKNYERQGFKKDFSQGQKVDYDKVVALSQSFLSEGNGRIFMKSPFSKKCHNHNKHIFHQKINFSWVLSIKFERCIKRKG